MEILAYFDQENLHVSRNHSVFSLTPSIQNKVDNLWYKLLRNAVSSKRPLWNGSIYRLHSLTSVKGKLHLVLSVIEYKTYLASPLITADLNGAPFSSQINGLYVGAVVVTSDGQYMLGKVTANSPFPHRYDFISGSLNENEQLIRSPDDIVRFIVNEFCEETSLPEEAIATIKGIAILRTSSSRIGIFYYISLNLTGRESMQLSKTNFEFSNLCLLSKNQAIALARDPKNRVNPTVELVLSLAPSV